MDVDHLHIDTTYIKKDLNVALPIDIVEDFYSRGIIGSISNYHYSIMGYQGKDTSHLANISSPEIAKSMKQDNVDLQFSRPSDQIAADPLDWSLELSKELVFQQSRLI